MSDGDRLESTENNEARSDTPPVQLASTAIDAAIVPPRERIGRYRVEKVLGEGGFGVVYLAHDDQLRRLVAIKVPHRHLVNCPEDAELYLTEACTVASLDHPNIVPVFDVGSTDDCQCDIVSKFIDGPDLAARRNDRRLSLQEVVDLIATIAAALHYAHLKRACAPRHQAGKHTARQRWQSVPCRFRRGAQRGEHGARPELRRHTRRYEPGTGSWRRASRRRPVRHLQSGRGLL